MTAGSDPRLTCLVIEDDAALLDAIVRHLERQLQAAVYAADSVASGTAEVLQKRPRLIVTDVYLKDGTCHPIVEAAMTKVPLPVVVAMSGRASAEEAFALATMGIRAYLAKPLSLSSLRTVLTGALSSSPPLLPAIAAQVGNVPIDIVKRDVRATMVRQALALTGCNRTECARILGVTRQAIQQMIRELDINENDLNCR